MERIAVVAFWLAMGLYAGATVLYGYFFLDKRRAFSWYATFLTGAGFICQTAAIGARWAARGSFPYLGGYDSLALTAWALVLIYFVVEHLIRIKTLGVLLIPVALLAMVVGQLAFTASAAAPDQLAEGWRVGIHVGLIMLANAGFALGGAASVLYLVQESQLKHHTTNVFFRRLPSLATTDQLARRVITVAFPVYTAGILLGTLRAIQFVKQWWFDPRVMMAGVVWLLFGSYIVLRYTHRVTGRNAAWLAVVGLAFVIVLAVLARTVPAGFHVFGISG